MLPWILNSKNDIIITSDQSIDIYTPESTTATATATATTESSSGNHFYANNIDINA
jgi:outer membrane lipoprotein-sorting protein